LTVEGAPSGALYENTKEGKRELASALPKGPCGKSGAVANN